MTSTTVNRTRALVPTPLERTPALVIADDSRAAVLVPHLRRLGTAPPRGVQRPAQTRSMQPVSEREVVVVDAGNGDDPHAIAFGLRRMGWHHVVIRTTGLAPARAALALARGVRVVLQPPLRETAENAQLAAADALDEPDEEEILRARRLMSGLTHRELAVIRLVATGATNREIGEAMDLSPLTIKSHLARVAQKVGTGDRAEIVLLAYRGGAII